MAITSSVFLRYQQGSVMSGDVIQSPDTLRSDRLPPGQTRTAHWPVRHKGEVPNFDPTTWDFAVFPKPFVEGVKRFTWPEFTSLPRVAVFADLHFECGESRLDNLWVGVSTREMMKHVTVTDAAKFVMIHCEHGYTTNLALDDFLGDDCLFAMRHDGQDLAPEYGGPLRLVVPRRYAYKSVKWVRGVEFMSEERPGFKERAGQHLRGDPWKEERRRD